LRVIGGRSAPQTHNSGLRAQQRPLIFLAVICVVFKVGENSRARQGCDGTYRAGSKLTRFNNFADWPVWSIIAVWQLIDSSAGLQQDCLPGILACPD
jgi:hypothetical protein